MIASTMASFVWTLSVYFVGGHVILQHQTFDNQGSCKLKGEYWVDQYKRDTPPEQVYYICKSSVRP